MRAFRVGDQFKGNQIGRIVQVVWVDPEDRFRAVISDVNGEFDDETVFAAQFLNYWTLTKEGPLVRPAKLTAA
jgi:hypothetical protein